MNLLPREKQVTALTALSEGASIRSVERKIVMGQPALEKICTSHIERLHLRNRMRNRRMTRLMDAHSKKRENFEASVGLTYWMYNFATRHSAIKTTPAQALGVTSKPLALHDLLDYAEASDRAEA